MSKGDELWKIRASILKRLYDEGAISEETAMLLGTLLSEVVGAIEGRAVTEEHVRALMGLLAEDELVYGDWLGDDIVPVWLRSGGFKEAHGVSAESEGEGGA